MLIVAVGVFARVHTYGDWQKHQQIFFFDYEPLLLNSDGYYYLRFARDLREDNYQPFDELRLAPEPPLRPQPPPLLSVLTAPISKITPFSLHWSAVLLPVILSLSLILPVFALCRLYNISTLSSLIAALVAISSQTYVGRTSMGVFDTDCLIVTFALSASVLAVGFGQYQNYRRYAYLLGAGINMGLFLWWWDQAPEAVILICPIPILISSLFYYRPKLRGFATVFTGVILSFLVFFFVFPNSFGNIFNSMLSIFAHSDSLYFSY